MKKIKVLAALLATLTLASCVPFWSCNIGGAGQPAPQQQGGPGPR
ncbi:hypothetical protein [Psittacicella gerlachiana]|nr:hypothetical protein [Psittacicella gerlachiana]